MKTNGYLLIAVMLLAAGAAPALGESLAFKAQLYDVGPLKSTDSVLKVAEGEMAPDFTLPSVGGEKITLSQFRGNKHVMLSFVPAAWTPVCSDQWPGYTIARSLFDQYDAVILGITVDNLPTLFAWTRQMGDIWFPVLSDFWPHGKVAERYGVLRGDGTAERALIFIDKNGRIRKTHVGDINERPKLDLIVAALKEMNAAP
ncbi:MAG: peroxiredoxin [Desulfobacterales bacterium]|jgi:peroxiredoxin (alkyl hydroperoxide reductase subunit C)|nr:peroxiredoxin [Desulfobacteraceae bacterium]MDD3990748.1 peroxiredoxin [Desulfobacteraceae bacterium]MDY0310975.1 peroxiredoxin [Desulfobacterales bacterium]